MNNQNNSFRFESRVCIQFSKPLHIETWMNIWQLLPIFTGTIRWSSRYAFDNSLMVLDQTERCLRSTLIDGLPIIIWILSINEVLFAGLKYGFDKPAYDTNSTSHKENQPKAHCAAFHYNVSRNRRINLWTTPNHYQMHTDLPQLWLAFGQELSNSMELTLRYVSGLTKCFKYDIMWHNFWTIFYDCWRAVDIL